MLFPRRSKSELRRTLERVGDDFDMAITAILEDDDMANSTGDPEVEDQRRGHSGNVILLRSVTFHSFSLTHCLHSSLGV